MKFYTKRHCYETQAPKKGVMVAPPLNNISEFTIPSVLKVSQKIPCRKLTQGTDQNMEDWEVGYTWNKPSMFAVKKSSVCIVSALVNK